MLKETLVRISVRELVEFILREGDIDNRKGGASEKEAMQLGSRIHRKIQRQMGADYRAEVPLKIQVPCDEILIQVEGRADGIFEENGCVVIDEIKGVIRDLESVKEPVGVHLSQAKCYAYIYGIQNQCKEMGVQMTYCQMETEDIKRFKEVYLIEDLEEWFLHVVRSYEKWARFQLEWRDVRNASAKQIAFPYEYREGQKTLATSVYKTILRKKKLFIEAPTGVGKTMATVFPAVKAVGEGLGDKIFYLTAKTITRTVAEQAFQTLAEGGLKYKVLTLTAKEKICFCEKAECNPDACPYAKGHYQRVNDAVYEMITTTCDMSRENIERQAKKHNVCPFEMALDLSLWVDAVICDYNYVFDPNVYLKRFFAEGKKGDYLFLIDEAHNLVERGRHMYSATLYKEDFLSVRKKIRYQDGRLYRYLSECNKILLEMKRECETYRIYESISGLVMKLMNVQSRFELLLEEAEQTDDEVLDFYFQVRQFLSIYDRVDEHYVIYTEFEEDERFKVKLLCVDPSSNLREFLSLGNSTIFFSATLLPIHYYKKLLGADEDDYAIYVNSPFAKENRLLLIGTDVSSRYRSRGQEMYEKYARYLAGIVTAREGNYLAFFPSYAFMQNVYEAFLELREEEETLKNVQMLLQDGSMSEEKREAFLLEFEENREKSLIGFCVMGGIFSEGIDLARERLIGAVIVGTGLPQVCHEREILKNYFEQQGFYGFDYAYLYPGMNKVLQAAGRVIRTEADKGVIALLDERFVNRSYTEIFPREWTETVTCKEEDVKEKVQAFWNMHTP